MPSASLARRGLDRAGFQLVFDSVGFLIVEALSGPGSLPRSLETDFYLEIGYCNGADRSVGPQSGFVKAFYCSSSPTARGVVKSRGQLGTSGFCYVWRATLCSLQ